MYYSSRIERVKDLVLGLNETIDQLTMPSSVGKHVLQKEDGRVLRRVLCLEGECQWKKGRLDRTWKKQVEEESLMVALSLRMHFAEQI